MAGPDEDDRWRMEICDSGGTFDPDRMESIIKQRAHRKRMAANNYDGYERVRRKLIDDGIPDSEIPPNPFLKSE